MGLEEGEKGDGSERQGFFFFLLMDMMIDCKEEERERERKIGLLWI